MTLEHLIETYGYITILIGCFLEGETILVLGGIASKLGYLDLPWVIMAAFTGALTADQFFFFIGRYHGTSFLRAHPSWNKRAEKAGNILERHRILIILGFRFLYGLRITVPLVIGMSRVPIIEFVLLIVIGAALWAIIIGTLGYAFGHGLELILGDIRRYEMGILAVVLLVGMLIWIIHTAPVKRQQK